MWSKLMIVVTLSLVCQAMDRGETIEETDPIQRLFVVINRLRNAKLDDRNQLLKEIKDLIAGGVTLDPNFFSRHTFLHYASGYKIPVDVAKLLISYGASCNVSNDNGATPLHIAAINNNVRVVELLIRKGADINVKDSNGYTPLHQAILHLNPAVVSVILAAKPDVDTQDAHGNTPLHYAVIGSSCELIRQLLKAGANPDQINHWSKTPNDVINTLHRDSGKIKKMLNPGGGLDTFLVFLWMEMFSRHYSKI